VGSFSEGLAPVGLLLASGDLSDDVSISDFRYGYIDKTGTVVIPIQYEAALASGFSGGVARLQTWANAQGGPVSTTYIDKTGKVIWQGE
jgi:hypothetical protein